jgi:hypothetical protein
VDDRIDRLEASLARIDEALRALEGRVAGLERAFEGETGRRLVEGPAGVAAPAAGETVAPAARPDLVPALSRLGRTVVVFGGAYVLRALTDAGTLPGSAGIALGLVYALAWLVAADRAAGPNWLSAQLHGAAAIGIGVPLLWEATTRFGLMAASTGVAALALLAALALTVAWRGRLQTLAWVASAGALGGALLFLRTGAVVPVTVFAIVLGIAALWLGYDRDWFGLRWPVALVADVLVLGVTTRALAGQERPGTAITVQVFLLVAYLAMIAARTVVRGRNVIPFEIAQAVAAFGVGLGGAVAVARATGSGTVPLGAATLGLAAATYAVAFAFVDRQQGRGLNFYCYTTLALCLTLAGAGLLLGSTGAALLWAALAVGAGVAGRQYSRVALTVHGAIYALVAAAGSGLLAAATAALWAPAAGAWPPFSLASWTVLAAVAVCATIPPPADQDGSPYVGSTTRAVVDALLVVSIAGVIVGALAPVIAGHAGSADAGRLATLRTTVLSLVAILIAWVGSGPRFGEMRWLLYPILLLAGFKLLFEDFPRSRPSTLFAALAVYGLALIVAPRLSRRAT